jgi:ketosteroid isomerase-like protein
MSQANLEIVRDQYAATNERDFSRAMSHYAEDVELIIPTGIRAGTFKGRQAVGAWFGDWFATCDRDARFDIEEIVEPDDTSVLLIAKHHASARASGVEVEEEVIWVYRLTVGKVTHLKAYDSRTEALAAVGLGE